MKLTDLAPLLKTAVLEGTEKVLVKNRTLSVDCTKAEAYRLYGRSAVDRWLQEGLISISKKQINRIKLEQVAASSNRISYLPAADR